MKSKVLLYRAAQRCPGPPAAMLWYGAVYPPFISNMEPSCQEVMHPLLSMSYVPDVMTAKRKSLIHAGAGVPFKLSWHCKARGNPAPLTVPAGLFLSIFPQQELCCLPPGKKTTTPPPSYIGHRWLKDQTASRWKVILNWSDSHMWDLYWRQGFYWSLRNFHSEFRSV